MSVVGNVTSNYDRTANAAGSPLQRKMSLATYDNSRTDGDAVEEVFSTQEQREEDIHELARQFTRQSRQSLSRQNTQNSLNPLSRIRSNTSTVGEPVNPTEYEPGSDMDPYSDNFDIRKWTRNAVKASKGQPHRTSGLA